MLYRPLSLFPALAAVAALFVGGCSSKSETGTLDDIEPDPVVLDIPMAYINRPIPIDEAGNRVADDILLPQTFNPGAVLYLKDRASSSAAEVDITSQAWDEGAAYDVKDISTSYDGERLLFAMRAPDIEGADEEDQPKWNIWEYDIPSATLRRVISDDIQAEIGHDLAPRYLPGVERRIVFASSRQTRSRAILLDDGKPQFSALNDDRDEHAFVLHVMDNDGTNIEQLTFNQSHDLQPALMADGRVLYSRWDRIPGNDRLSFYSVDPYGMRQSLVYGYHSQNTGTDDTEAFFLRPVQLADGRVFGIQRARQSVEYGGNLVAVDVENFIAANQPIDGGSGTQAQTALYPLAVSTNDTLSINGIFHSASPLFDGTGRFIVSWSRCRVINPDNNLPAACNEDTDPAAELADPLFGVYIFDPAAGTQQPILLPREGRMLTEPTLLIPREQDNLIPPPTADIDYDANLADQELGSLHIKSVYDFDGTDAFGIETLRNPANWPANRGQARFLRLVKAVSIPDRDVLNFPNTAFGRSANNGMREILGYVPIEPDGSVLAKVPADVAISFDIVDAQGRRVNGFGRHNNWLQLRPGEQRSCNGCHTRQSELPHGRPDAEPEAANTGAPTTGQPFENTDPALFTDMGETMAETFARINGMRTPSADIAYTDEWTDQALLAPEPDITLSFADLLTEQPAGSGCDVGSNNWSAQCRVTIHYPDHIQPLWDLPRADDPDTPTEDWTCVSCHTERDAMGAAQVPAGQLDLRALASPQQQDHFIGYRELLFNDNEQELVDGALVDRLVQAVDDDGNPIYETDDEGNLILDDDGNPIPVLVTVQVTPTMRVNGARASSAFFNKFEQAPGPDDTVDHRGYLTEAELKLISEWLDVGAQYYNNPFAVPVN
ncbi:hypothetical protein L1F30_17265 [Simiduia sp. 21SJ11W-1]|uniref:HzsA-related protein n=1 Tax=Simiduia sp. 21SJ11W-1 TaxID=2909669 RepID=UPI00209D388D|nr:hypothetical protein [Simiduia sp. 21SJ11W-1]UTA47891.1 hypothetical protein L1F30_17265 [Simiduia sp. 21SJ11W-1]